MNTCRISSVVILGLITGCSGQIYTTINPDFTNPDTGSDKDVKVEGIIAYRQLDVIEVFQARTLSEEDSKEIVGTAANGDCKEKNIYKFSTRADYSNPYILNYDAGWFETNTFAVTLKSGVLESINTSSDPSKTLSALAAFLPYVPGLHAPTAAVAPSGAVPYCNDGEVLVGVYRAPEVRPASDIPTND